MGRRQTTASTPSFLRVTIATACLAALLAPPTLAATPPGGHHAAKGGRRGALGTALVTLGPGLLVGPAIGITMAPVGLSLEYPVMAQDLGSGACPPPALVSELEQLGSPPIELGGQSQDFTAPAGAAPLAPSSWEGLSTYTLAPSFWSQLHCLLGATRDPLTVGLNARIGLPSWAAQMVAGAEDAATNGLSFSLGNEPDLYYLPDFASLDKPQAGEEAIDIGRYLQAAGALAPELGGAPITGPELSGPRNWQLGLPHVIAALGLRTLGVHDYPLSVCRTPFAATIGGLLDPSVGNAPRALAWVVADAAAAGIPAIISEANSVSCGGKAGVSDSPAAAVWAVRFVLSALRTGFREVRFHFSGDPYDAFIVRGGEVLDRPLESALVALNQWLPVGSSLYPLAGLKGLAATVLASAAGPATLILDNERRQSRVVELRGARPESVQELSPARVGLATVARSVRHGLVRLTLPANTLAAVTWTPSA